MYVGAVILRRCQSVMPYDAKFHNHVSERIWKKVDLAWLSYYSSNFMGGLRKPHTTSFVADVRFYCPTVFWSEGMVCKYVTDFAISTGPFSGHRSPQTLQITWAGCTNFTLVSAQTDGHIHARTHTHTRTHFRASKICAIISLPWLWRFTDFRKFLPEDKNLNLHNTFLLLLYAWFLSIPEGADLLWDPPNLLLSRYLGGGGGG
jgi:hypothetical protein